MKTPKHYAIALLMQKQNNDGTTDLRNMLYCIWEADEAAAIKEAERMAFNEIRMAGDSGYKVLIRNTIEINHQQPE